ncbi:MAG: ABC transporter permease [Phycisphaerales bacterium]
MTSDRANTLRRFLRNPAMLVGLVVLLTLTLASLVSLPWTLNAPPGAADPRYNQTDLDAFLLPPTWAMGGAHDDAAARYDALGGEPFFVMGTDNLGRDLFVRCLAGGGVSIGIGLAAALIAVVIGTLYGAIAALAGGRVDGVMMRIVDILYGLPYVLLVVLLAVAGDAMLEKIEMSAGQRQFFEVVVLLIAIGGVSWLTMARVIRGQVLSLKAQPFMEAARATAIPVRTQFLRHLLPNLLAPIIVYATLTVPQAILQESFLSFLGIGVQPPLPSWGNLAADGLSELNPVRVRWWLIVFPCCLLALTLLALNFVGEGLRDAFDPKRSAT